MQPVAEQILIFLMLVLLGHCIGVLYDLYRVIRRAHGLKKWGTNLGDAVFWIIVTAVTYSFLLIYIWGEVRVYVFIAMIFGFYIYLKLFSSYVLEIFFSLHNLLSKIVRSVVKVQKKIYKNRPPQDPPSENLS